MPKKTTRVNPMRLTLTIPKIIDEALVEVCNRHDLNKRDVILRALEEYLMIDYVKGEVDNDKSSP